ncbi:hypothetical protein Q3G72_018347 [Acer saccharum]|nr:hypothetical protein Q3G72_018347 [Acer saccharum]
MQPLRAREVVIVRGCLVREVTPRCPVGVSIIIESDCKCAVGWVNGEGAAAIGRNLDLIVEIRELLHRNSPRISVSFVPRSSNVAADLLAKLGPIRGVDQVVWRS